MPETNAPKERWAIFRTRERIKNSKLPRSYCDALIARSSHASSKEISSTFGRYSTGASPNASVKQRINVFA